MQQTVTIQFDIADDIARYRADLAALPNLTERQARKLVARLRREVREAEWAATATRSGCGNV